MESSAADRSRLEARRALPAGERRRRAEALLDLDKALDVAVGGDATSGESCAEAASIAAEAVAANGDIQRLVEIEERFGPPPSLPGGQCPVTFKTTSLGE